MEKADGAFLTISELAGELAVPQHILRYWETRFPALRPLQRSGNRRYYRPADVVLARRINQLLNVEGFTVRGAQKALTDGAVLVEPPAVRPSDNDFVNRLVAIRAALAAAIDDGAPG
ncbi:MerR family transcriptional regulator [Sphingobium sp. AN558]|uniref:MerR family transcriptional regulator n=1 Tax=Sphingobium sp. AN558 TaxID=3133442 RepID=UPI0030BDF043